MINAKYVRDNLEAIKASLSKRQMDYPIERILQLDKEWREIKTETQKLEEKRNKESLEIANLKKSGKSKEAEEKIKELAEIKNKIEENKKKLEAYEKELNELLWNMPNILHESVPYGKDSNDNVEIKRVGEPKDRELPGHEEILKKLDMIDLEDAAKVAGARFYYLKSDIALLELSLIRFAIDTLVKKGYTLIAPPHMMKREYYKGVTALGDFEDALYRVGESKEAMQNKNIEHVEDELFLISTSEHPIAAMHANYVFSANELPKKYVGWSPCFRREAGAHGKDTKGIFRVHQFYKVEQFIFSRQEDSWKYHEELRENEEEIFKALGIPYRIVNICTGDIGIVAAKKYDLEAYLPVQKKYGEMCSCSNCTDWQSMRLDIKYDEKNERKYVHTLNATAIATERAIVAIVENYANEDGTITVPEVLVPYMGKRKIG
ncbi:MAG: serine--tRNA ligase [Candidatus Micrarchaeia archaeon]